MRQRGNARCAGIPFCRQHPNLDRIYDCFYNDSVKTLAAAKFKEQCLALLDRVDPEGIVITKHGRPVAKLIPAGADSAGLIGSLKGKLRIKGDILSTGLAWNAQPRYPRPSARARR